MTKTLGRSEELIELEKRSTSINFVHDGKTISEALIINHERTNKEEREITEKKKYPFGPEHWYISGGIEKDMPPKEVYKLVNPNDELCQFTIGVGSKTYKFFHNIVQGKKYRHYDVVEVKSYDF